MDTVEQRLDRLERENRWWKFIGIATVAILGLVVLTGAAGSTVADVIRAKGFADMAYDPTGASIIKPLCP